jgi:molybdenum cofactor biosynthesis enzyme MoaA
MTGLQMLLSQLGIKIDPAEIMRQYEELKTGIPKFAQALSEKVQEIDARLTRIEIKVDAMLKTSPAELTGVPRVIKEVTNGIDQRAASE